MTTNTLEERKQNIDHIKASFPNPALSSRYRDFSSTEEEQSSGHSFFAIKLLVALALFLVFLYCDKTQLQYKGYTTEQVYQQIEETISWSAVRDFLPGFRRLTTNLPLVGTGEIGHIVKAALTGTFSDITLAADNQPPCIHTS